MHFRIVLLCLAVLAGCASRQDQTRFPTLAELQKVADRPVPKVDFQVPAAQPSEWTLKGPFPSMLGDAPHPTDGTFNQTFVPLIATAAPGLEASGPLACVAREVGHFALAHGEMPVPDFLHFINGRCGSAFDSLATNWVQGDVPDSETDEALAQRWSESVQKGLRSAAGRGPHGVGVWFGRSGGKAVAVVISGRRSARVQPVSLTGGADGVFELAGESLIPAEEIYANINRGEFGYARCDKDPLVKPPQFKFRCEGSKDDSLAWVSVGTRAPGRVLGIGILRALVSPSGVPDDTWRVSPYQSELPEGVAFDSLFTRLVNEVRARAGLPPVELELAQSATAARVAPHFFEASRGEDPEKITDTIALGMMAGWEVGGGLIQYGTFATDWIYGSLDVRELVSSMLMYPSGRSTLLDPKARRIAVGPLQLEEEKVLGVVASTYALQVQRSTQELETEVIQALNKARASKGLEPVVWVTAPGNSHQVALEKIAQGEEPNEVTRYMLDAAIEVTQQSMRGWTLETWDLERIDFPNEVILAPKLAVVLAVAPYRSPGSPWGGYAVMMVLPDLSSLSRPNTVASAR